MDSMNIEQILNLTDVQQLINAINMYTPDEAKRCRLLLAKMLLILMKN